MHHEFRSPNRDAWKYDYTGSELIDFAQQKIDDYKKMENDARTRMSALIADRSVAINGNNEMKKLEDTIKGSAEQIEMCQVFLHEFKRKPDRVYHLSLSDVVYFRLIEES